MRTLSKLKPRLNYANVVSTLALFVVLGGTAYAHGLIGPRDIQRGAIKSLHVDRSTVKAPHIARGAILAPHLRRNAVASPHVRISAIGARHLQGEAVGTQAIQKGAVTADRLSDDVGVRGPQGKRGPAGNDATNLWAYVSGDGDKVIGSGAVNSSNTIPGKYTVTFKDDVSECSYQVTPGIFNVVTGARADNNNVFAVTVHTGIYEGGGGNPVVATNINSDFYISVFC